MQVEIVTGKTIEDLENNMNNLLGLLEREDIYQIIPVHGDGGWAFMVVFEEGE